MSLKIKTETNIKREHINYDNLNNKKNVKNESLNETNWSISQVISNQVCI